jgi:hypothetical protein
MNVKINNYYGTYMRVLQEMLKKSDAIMETICDALLGPGVNPLEGSPNVKLWKLGPKGTLPASNSRKG